MIEIAVNYVTIIAFEGVFQYINSKSRIKPIIFTTEVHIQANLFTTREQNQADYFTTRVHIQADLFNTKVHDQFIYLKT